MESGRAYSIKFKDVIQHVRNGVQQWSSKFLSSGGKEILIKACAQAILTFTMNYFLLPKNIIHELDKIILGYWWDDKGTKREIH